MMRPGGVAGGWRRYARDTRGAAGVEFALWLTLLSIPIFTVVDLGDYIFQRMQVDNAAQIAAQDAWTTCNALATWPATANCGTSLNTAVSTGAHSTSLGSSVTVLAGSEGWYCTNSAGVLTIIPTSTAGVIAASGSNTAISPATQPANCSSVVAGSTTPPGDYLLINVSYTFHPLFKGASLTALLPTTVTRTAWTRLY